MRSSGSGDDNTSVLSRDWSFYLAIAGEHLEKSHRLSRARLDYVFTDLSWKTEASWVVRIGPSDHWPLIADLVLKRDDG